MAGTCKKCGGLAISTRAAASGLCFVCEFGVPRREETPLRGKQVTPFDSDEAQALLDVIERLLHNPSTEIEMTQEEVAVIFKLRDAAKFYFPAKESPR